MAETLIIDCETTGNDLLEVIELAAIEARLEPTIVGGIDCILGNVIIDERFDPACEIALGALATHHILPEELKGCRPTSEVTLPDCEYVVGHNVDYDWSALGEPPVKRICTLALARHVWPDLDCHRLGALTYHCFGSAAKQLVQGCHSALHDVILTSRILGQILPLLESVNDWHSLWKASELARVPTVMPFGKHRGTPMAQVPRDYKNWLMRQDDVDPYLMRALEA